MYNALYKFALSNFSLYSKTYMISHYFIFNED